MRSQILILLLALLLPVAAQAQSTATVNASGNWNSSGTWSSVPGGFAPINGQNGQNWNAIINNTSRTVTVNAATILEGLTFSAGGINGTSTLTLNAASIWSGGNFTDAGITNFNGGVAITANGQGITARTVNLGGNSAIGDGTMMIHVGTVANNGIFDMTNLSGLTVSHGGYGGTWSNTGTINKNGAGTATFSSVNFNNTSTGVVNVNEGIINVAYQGNGAGGGTATGTFNIASGAEFRVSGPSYTMNAGVQVNGGGLFNAAGGTTTFNGTSIGSNGNLGIGGGRMTFASGANFTTSGGFVGTSGFRDGTGTVNFEGASVWTGGNMGQVASTAAGVTNFIGGVAITANGQYISGIGTVNLQGTSSIGSGSMGFYNGGTLANQGTLEINNSSALDFNHLGFGGTVSNSGTINKSGAGTVTVASGVGFSNTGVLNLTEGAVTLNNVVTQHSGTALTGGTWNVSNGSTLTFTTGSNLTTIGSAASVLLDGATTTFNRIPTTASTLTTNQGSFTLKNDRDITTAGAFANSGTVSIQDGATTFKIGATGNLAYTQTGPSSVTILAGGAMIDTSAFNLNGGALQGSGTIDGQLSATTANATSIAPGASPGTITINGSTVLGGSNTLAMEIGGLAQGTQHDYMDVNGVLTLGGLLDVDFINLFENSVQFSDIFTIATADSPILGAFSNMTSGSRIGTNAFATFEVWYGAGSPYGANNLVLTAAPEPSRALLVVLSIAGALMRRRRA